METVTNYVRVDELSRAYVKPVKAILDRIGQPWPETLTRKHVKCEFERETQSRRKSNAGIFRCFRCNEAGHVVANRPKPPTQGAKGKGKGKGKGQGKKEVDGNSNEKEKER